MNWIFKFSITRDTGCQTDFRPVPTDHVSRAPTPGSSCRFRARQPWPYAPLIAAAATRGRDERVASVGVEIPVFDVAMDGALACGEMLGATMGSLEFDAARARGASTREHEGELGAFDGVVMQTDAVMGEQVARAFEWEAVDKLDRDAFDLWLLRSNRDALHRDPLDAVLSERIGVESYGIGLIAGSRLFLMFARLFEVIAHPDENVGETIAQLLAVVA